MKTTAPTKERPTLSANQLIARIRSIPRLSKIFTGMSPAEKAEVLSIADGDDWRIENVIAWVVEARDEK
jgi:hypothetical protein